ncbi:MAG: hypothetical protein KDA42_06680 [Planctomycetales bacterium]|nr:hypothetical protein [Planctomycetales bacterium]
MFRFELRELLWLVAFLAIWLFLILQFGVGRAFHAAARSKTDVASVVVYLVGDEVAPSRRRLNALVAQQVASGEVFVVVPPRIERLPLSSGMNSGFYRISVELSDEAATLAVLTAFTPLKSMPSKIRAENARHRELDIFLRCASITVAWFYLGWRMQQWYWSRQAAEIQAAELCERHDDGASPE